MKIAILGGGITGLTAAITLAKKGHHVTLIEKLNELGGLAVGFKQPNWDWYLERAYHHLFSNDSDIIDFSKEIGFDKIFFNSPETASLFPAGLNKRVNQELRIYPMDTPIDFLKLPIITWIDKIRAGATIAFLKLSPFLSIYEKKSAENFIKMTMGDNVWYRLWQELFRKKFGNYAEIVLASFIWARITKRTKNLGYIEGGFQTFINHLEKELVRLNVDVRKGYEIKSITKKNNRLLVNNIAFDKIVSTLPTAIMAKVTDGFFPPNYLRRFEKLRYLHAMTLVLESKEPLLKKTYWLNISTHEIPIMGIVQHTNLVDKKNYGGNHLVYLGWYLPRDDERMKMPQEELVKFVKPHINRIFSLTNPGKEKFEILNTYLFRAPWAQPIFDQDFVANKPDFITPEKDFLIANLDMTYPYDRGTNYAVKLGKEVSAMI